MIISSVSSSIDDKQSDFLKLVSLSLPLMFTLCATTVAGFFDRLFLANHSMVALEGYVSGCVLITPFQLALMRMTTLGQAFVSSYNNDSERHCIGESIWQLIWLSLFSMFIALPIGYAIMPFALKGSPVEEAATSYFACMLWGIFLFPLQAALSSFFIGRKETKVVLITIISAQCLHVLLDWLLIFGAASYIPPLGILGTSIALIVNQIMVCAVLFYLFLKKSHRDVYGTNRYHFNWKVFQKQLWIGIPVALAPFISASSWTATSHVMSTNSADHLTVFSVGSTLTLCFAFISNTLLQSVMIFASSIFKEGNFLAIKRLIIHAVFLLSIVSLLLAIPFLVYPEPFLRFFFPMLSISSERNVLFLTCYSSWFFLFCQGILYIGMGLLVATQKTSFFIFTGCLQWITAYLFIFMAINVWHWPAETLFLLLSVNALAIAALYFLKTKQLISG